MLSLIHNLKPDQVILVALATQVLLVGTANLLQRVRSRASEQVLSKKSSLLWSLLFFAVMLVFLFLNSRGLYTGESEYVLVFAGVCLVATIALLLRERLANFLARRSATSSLPWLGIRDGLCVLLAIVLGHLAVELPFNDMLPLEFINGLIFELATIALAVLILYFFSQQHGAIPAIVLAACSVIGIAEFYVIRFKGTTIQPGDLTSLNTAAAVAANYDYSFGNTVLLGVSAALLGVAILLLIVPASQARMASAQKAKHFAHTDKAAYEDSYAPARVSEAEAEELILSTTEQTRTHLGHMSLRTRIIKTALGLVLLATMVGTFVGCNFRRDFGVAMAYWDWRSLEYVKKYGFITGFLVGVQDLKIEVPEGYSEVEAKRIEKELAQSYDESQMSNPSAQLARAQFEAEKPTVIVVMNEAFSDLSSLGADQLKYEGPTFFSKGSPQPALRGALAVSVLGGGTCNSEFEFLSGTSMAFVGGGKYPYSFYDLSRINSLAKQFSELGYKTSAMHPNKPGNWARDKGYRGLGFDQFLSIDDFDENAQTYHAGLTDAETYKKILELLSDSSAPQFILDVTMQNHSGYTMGSAPKNYRAGIVPNGFSADDEVVAELNEYLDCIDHSDSELKSFLTQLETLDRKVVLVFFGDHMPDFAEDLNDAFHGNGEKNDIAHRERIYHSHFAVWSNYEIAGFDGATREQADSADVLAARVLELTGAPLSDYQKARLAISNDIAELNLFGFKDNAGGWHRRSDMLELESSGSDDAQMGEQKAGLQSLTPEARAAWEAYKKLSFVEYLEFGAKY